MIRKFEFTPNEQGKIDFFLIYSAFLGRGSDANNPKRTQQTRADHLLEAKIAKALKNVSEPYGEIINGSLIDVRPRKLKLEGGVIELEQSSFSRLLKFIEETQWSASVVEQAVDVLERFESCEKVS